MEKKIEELKTIEDDYVRAYRLVSYLFRDKKDKAGLPYLGHLTRVSDKISTGDAKIAALLHDVASVTDVTYTEEHHIIGAKIAEELLLQENYPIEKIEQIKKCILNHRGSRLASKNSPEEICIADSDAMAHFYSIPSLLSMVYREKNLSIDEGSKFVMEKLERSYNKMSTKGKKLVKKQYESAKNILK